MNRSKVIIVTIAALITIIASVYMSATNEAYNATFYKIGDISYVKTDMGSMLASEVDTNDSFTSGDTYGYLISWMPAMLPNTSGQIDDTELLSK